MIKKGHVQGALRNRETKRKLRIMEKFENLRYWALLFTDKTVKHKLDYKK